MAVLTEAEARAVLERAGSPAADPATYRGRRVAGGWVFSWRPDVGAARIGTIAWLVSDAGWSRGLGLFDDIDELLAAGDGPP